MRRRFGNTCKLEQIHLFIVIRFDVFFCWGVSSDSTTNILPVMVTFPIDNLFNRVSNENSLGNFSSWFECRSSAHRAVKLPSSGGRLSKLLWEISKERSVERKPIPGPISLKEFSRTFHKMGDYLNLLKLKFKVTRESNDFNAELSSHHLLNPFSLKSNSVSEGRPKIWCGISPSNSFLCSRSSFSDLKLLNRWKRALASD